MSKKKKVEMKKISLELYPGLYDMIKKIASFSDYSINEAINQLLMSHDLITKWWQNDVAIKMDERDKELFGH